jgi:hypothetical protein
MNQSSALDLKSSFEQLIITHIIFYEVRLLLSHHLAVFDQELGHAVSTMNRSFALDLKSPLESSSLPTNIGEKGRKVID